MPALGNALDFAKYEARNLRHHQLGTAPASPVTGQMYYNTADNTLYWWDGTAWQSAKGGTGTPTGPAGGDLSGTYPNPQIATGVIVDADVNAANKDGAVGTPSLRTLGAGAAQAMPGNRTLDAIANPVAARAMNGQKITGMADGTAATDAVTRQQLDAVAQGLDVKASVRCATTANISINSAPATIDSVALAFGERILVKDQTNAVENGIYTYAGTGSPLVRATDADTSAEVSAGLFTFVSEGSTNQDTGWVLVTNDPITLGTSTLVFSQFSGAGTITAGAGLTQTGTTLNVGAGTGISVAADTVGLIVPVSVANGGTGGTTPAGARTAIGAAGYYSSATHGAGTTITITAATHGLGAKRGIQVQVQEEATGLVVIPDMAVAANGDVTVTFGASVAANAYRVTLVG